MTAQVLMRRFSKIAKSFAVLLVDARNAFYSLLLEQVSGAADQESALNKVLEKISDLFPKFPRHSAPGCRIQWMTSSCVGQLASSQLDFGGWCARYSVLFERHEAR